MVFVLNKHGQPLMPCKPQKARVLLKNGGAKVVQHKPFTIQLTYETNDRTQPLTLGIDTGTGHIGVAVTKENGEAVFLGELETRNKEITKNIEDRKQHRQARRRYSREKQKRRATKSNTIFNEKGYIIVGCEKEIVTKKIKPRKIRFQNRKRTEKWLTPTCQHLLQTHINFVNKIKKILPITKVIVEYAKFDIHKIKNPDITGDEYQNGRKKGFTNTQEYVLCRDNHTCRACKKKTGKLHVHHVVWKSQGGADQPENLLTLCERCHDKVHKNQKFNKKIVKLHKGIKKIFNTTTILNSIMPKFYEWLESNFYEVEGTYGYETKNKRREFGLEKTHWIDAYLVSIGNRNPVNTFAKPYTFKQFRRHNRANIQAQIERNYYLGKKKAAINRIKRTGQTFDSLKDLVQLKGFEILNKLTVKKGYRRKRTIKPFGMGDVVSYLKQTYVVKGYTGTSLGFIGESKYNFPMKKTIPIIKNTGIVCTN